jgi:hypothetical protein
VSHDTVWSEDSAFERAAVAAERSGHPNLAAWIRKQKNNPKGGNPTEAGDGQALPKFIRENDKNQREHDLVRQMRIELFTEELISEAEYSALASEHGGVQRLNDYDALRAEMKALRQGPVGYWTRENAALAARAKALVEAWREFDTLLNDVENAVQQSRYLESLPDDFLQLLYNGRSAVNAALSAPPVQDKEEM